MILRNSSELISRNFNIWIQLVLQFVLVIYDSEGLEMFFSYSISREELQKKYQVLLNNEGDSRVLNLTINMPLLVDC